MTFSLIGRLALATVSMLALAVNADNGCHLDPNGCPGHVVVAGDGGPGMDPNG
ncbi:hypothetical protein [Rhizocola hellebori]|nr:hypothetical protein [Rhizocola hellebori]